MTETTQHNSLTKLFYGVIGIASSSAFFLVLYWVLRLDSSITNVITNTSGEPLYFWPYVLLTLGAIVLFGVNMSLLAYRWRKWGFPRLRRGFGGQASAGMSSFVGIGASACPVCGSTLLSAVGIAGGLAAFPLGGLELKALSFGFMALPVWLIRRDMKKLEECKDGRCPVARDTSVKEEDKPWLLAFSLLAIGLLFASWNMLKTDPVIAKLVEETGILNLGDNTLYSANVQKTGNALFDETVAQVLPEQGFQSKIALGNSVVKLAQNTYRPCCNNSTFFQDCNHGSALLGLLQLGASQGLTEDELYREALVFNSFWFPHNYIQTALYLKAVENIDWENVDAKLVMGRTFSSISGNRAVQAEVAKIPNLVPQQQGGASCGV